MIFNKKNNSAYYYYICTNKLINNKKYVSKKKLNVDLNLDNILTPIYYNSYIYKVKVSSNSKEIIPIYLYIYYEIIDVDYLIIRKTQYYDNGAINSITYLQNGKKNNYLTKYAVSIYNRDNELVCEESYKNGMLHNDDNLPSMVIYQNHKVKEMRYYKHNKPCIINGLHVIKF